MVNLVFLPAVRSPQELADIIARASWYLYPYRSQIGEIRVFLQDCALPGSIGDVPDLYDPGLAENAKEIANLFRFDDQSEMTAEERNDLFSKADALFIWRAGDPALKAYAEDALITRMKKVGRHFEVDPTKTRMEGSFYLWAGLNVFADSAALTSLNKTKFQKFLESLPNRKRAYVFGTGPSLSSFAARHDFSDGHCFVSNSMVKNHDLLEKLKPVAIVAADPIFHAGCSRYAAAFRKELIYAMRKHGSYFITSLRDYNVFVSYLPDDLRERVIGVPFNSKAPFNADLSKEFYVQPLANILTLLLLPLAGAAAEEICIVGCDGRPRSENQYFWGHDKAVQFNDEMENIKLVHPAFFGVDYDDYYDEHCKNVELAVSALEQAGRTISVLTPSYVPSLAARGPRSDGETAQNDTLSSASRQIEDCEGHVVVLDPDGINNSGHFLSYDRRIWETCRDKKVNFTLFGREDIEADTLPSEIQIVRCFTVNSWSIGTQLSGGRAPKTDQFMSELEQALRINFPSSRKPVTLYLYCGSLEHAYAIHSVICKFDNIYANINLFWHSRVTYEEVRYLNRWRPLIATLTASDRITLTVPSETLRKGIQHHFGISLETAPHPSTTFSDNAAYEYSKSAPSKISQKLTVLFPGGALVEKGVGLTAATVKLLGAAETLSLKVRANRNNATKAGLKILGGLKDTKAELVSKTFENNQFREFLESGDIIVCPYLKSHFSSRTSGLVIDSMILGRPVVALKETWLGDLVESQGFGIAADANAKSIADAVLKIIGNYNDYSSRAATARIEYLESHSWSRLIDEIVEINTDKEPPKIDLSADISEGAKNDIIGQLPSNLRSPIFLPTNRIPHPQQIDGLRNVVDLYDQELDTVYRPLIRSLKESRRHKRCFIIGNGPSLNSTDLSKLKGETTFATNGFFLKLPELDWAPTYYVVEDHLVAEDRAHEINLLRGFTKLFPANLRYILKPDRNTVYFDHRPRKSYPDGFDFSFDADVNTFAGGTVTFTCMQLAAYLGYEEIYLIGVDADYAIPKDAELSGTGKVKEIDMPSDDPNHFHVDYFGKGKRWHEPNVKVMRAAYKKANAASKERGVEIINATVGGKLEVFPRVDYDAIFYTSHPLPRLLLIDLTRIGDATATGELKASLLHDWPADRLFQIFDGGFDNVCVSEKATGGALSPPTLIAANEIEKRITAFRPDAIIYRPTPGTVALHEFAMEIIKKSELPLITWIMDDWPAAQETTENKAFERLEADWRSLVQQAKLRLSIGEKMSAAFSARYGAPFAHFANGVDPKDWLKVVRRAAVGSVRVRYAGSLAENMTLHSVRLVAEAVESLAADGIDIIFEIKTRELWHQAAAAHFESLSHTHFVTTDFSMSEYRDWLSAADIIVIAYNFDDASTNYVRYSVANKLPECLASGAALLAVGPADGATMSLLEKLDCGARITENRVTLVKNSLADLAASTEKRFTLAQKAQQTAFEEFDIKKISASFTASIKKAAEPSGFDTVDTSRDQHAHVDETAVVAHLLEKRRGRDHVMLDVGAHHGSSAKYFDRLSWTVHCFEPDAKNREKLIESFGVSKNVTIDARAVSDKPAKGVSFYSSKESTGISGLHAFRKTHRESGLVDVTTVAEIVAAHGIKHVDFLKIDVEGFDYSVIKGVPWGKLTPDVVECEFEDAKTASMGHTWRDVAEFLRQKGYAVYLSEWHPIIRYGIPHDWRRIVPFPGADMANDAWGNILAFREDPGYKAVSDAFGALLKRRTAKPTAKPATEDVMTAHPFPSAITHIAHFVHRRSPRLFSLLRFAKRILGHMSRRKVWTLPVLFTLVSVVAIGLHPAYTAYRTILWGGAVFSALVLAIAYLAFRIYAITERLAAEKQDAQRALNKVTAALGEVRKQSDAARRQTAFLSPAVAAEGKRVSALTERLRDIDERAAQTSTHLSDALTALREEFTQELEGQKTQTSSRLRDFDAKMSKTPNNSIWFQRFNRQLKQEHIEIIDKEWSRRLSVKMTEPELGYMASRACEVETMLSGRLATSIEDVLLRTIVSRGVENREIQLLEIGTLFGTGAAIMYDALAPYFDSVHFTLLDPLDGYYSSVQNDVLTGQPVNEEMLRHNLNRVGMADESFTLIKKLSTEIEAVEEARSREYDVLIIDGDHSYAGVKADFDNYAPMVRMGGYIIIDDYAAEDWPDVTRFVDTELEKVEFVARVGANWRTCVYRVVKPQDSAFAADA